MHPYQRNFDLCASALDSVRSLIPKDLYQDVRDYIHEFNEWGLGMEVLIDQISEFDIKISQNQYNLIYEAMASMGLEKDNRVSYLRDHNVSS